ncbi:hypothetical protein [Paenibacillus oceani]|uniref:Uncharacterized protein n=1 Tax=Paenibacillus oceani TaxID=2772510 RepID=A0A927H2S6_9BACL|nr:hypothetical protein [Paenibacillus oceani]MBD2865592.1 hypothetical protein [Paenibacillus oceani]
MHQKEVERYDGTIPKEQAMRGQISRRKVLASIGLAGAALVAAGRGGQVLGPLQAQAVTTVTYDTYGPDPSHKMPVKTFTQLLDAVASPSKPTVLIEQEIKVTASFTVPAGVTLLFLSEGKLQIQSGIVVTVHGEIHAPTRQLFQGPGHVDGLGSVCVDWFCADGDAVADQSDGLRRAFFGKPRHVRFSDRTYRYESSIVVAGFGRMMIEGNGARLVDAGKWLVAINTEWGSRNSKNFNGFLFEDFEELYMDHLTLSSTEEYEGAWGYGILASPGEQRPHLSVDGRANQGDVSERRGKVVLNRLTLRGQGGSYINMTAQPTLKQAMSPSFIRVTHCEQAELSDIGIEGDAGGAEMICIGECGNLHVHGLTYVREGAVVPVSVGKFIRCDRQLLERMYIDCPDHTPDCFDLSAKDEIIIRDSYVNWTGGDRFELTSEWRQYNIDIGHVYISNVGGGCKDFMTVQKAAAGYENTIESITVSDMAIEARFISSGFYAKRTAFHRCLIRFTAGTSGCYTYNDTEFHHCTFYPSEDLSVRLWPRGAGARLKLSHCLIHQLQLWTGTASESTDVDIAFEHCRILYEDYPENPFNSAVYYGVNLAKGVRRLEFYDCEIAGPMRGRAFFIQNRSGAPNIVRELVVRRCRIELSRSTLADGMLSYDSAALITIDNSMQTLKNRMWIADNRFGKQSSLLRCAYSNSSASGMEGIFVSIEGNTFTKGGTQSVDVVNPSGGFWDTVDLALVRNVFEGSLDPLQLADLQAKARSFVETSNIQLGNA